MVPEELLREAKYVHVRIDTLHLGLHEVSNNSYRIIVVTVLYNYLNKIDLREYANERPVLVHHRRT